MTLQKGRVMSRFVNLDEVAYAAEIDAEIAYIRQSGALGRSAKLEALFDYLVERSRSGVPPREIEIAQDVFGTSQSAAQDGISRVYIHRLRARLKELNANSQRPVQINLPLGQYKFEAEVDLAQARSPDDNELTEARPEVPYSPPRQKTGWSWRPSMAAAAFITFIAFIAGVLIGAVYIFGKRDQVADLRNSAVWSSLLNAPGDAAVIEGDYYMFAELGSTSGAMRVIHDPAINSPGELETYLVRNPAKANSYADVGFSCVPYSVSFAQHRLSPMIARLSGAQVSMMSHTTPGRMLMQNVVYIGLTGGLGRLADPLFASARFRRGQMSDEIWDSETKRGYVGTRKIGSPDAQLRQYGLLSSFAGGRGNRYLVLAGTGDLALIGLSQVMMDSAALAQLAPYAAHNQSFEALYEIEGQHTVITSLKLIGASTRDPSKIWAPQ
jgi:hypothetical protein